MTDNHIQYYHKVMQGGDEWYALRLGILTASAMKNCITPTLKVANNDKTKSHVYEIVAQRVTGFVEPTFQTYDMVRGHTEEVYAKGLYSENYNQVQDCGFITNNKYGFTLGFSPDGLIGEHGLIEVKSRNQKTQVKTIVEEDSAKYVMIQIQTGLMVSERKWCDFISYSNGMPMYVQRILPDEYIQAAILEAANEFENKCAEVMKKYLENTKELFVAERRDYEDGGDVIKPSHTGDGEIIDYTMAG